MDVRAQTSRRAIPMDLHADSGQSTIEWLALMAMLVALAGVLVTTMPGLATRSPTPWAS